jgi:hypothetical protein
MRKTLITIAAAAILMLASAWADDADYSLELHPAACKAATARIVAATGGIANTDPLLARPGFATFEIPGSDIIFTIDCGTSPETISANTSLGAGDNHTEWVTIAARMAHGLTGDRLSATAAAVERCLGQLRKSSARDTRRRPYRPA